jgi:adenylate cyclase
LSRVTVVGIPVPVRLYELLELRANATSEMLETVKLWEEGFKFYEKLDFARAKSLFYEVSKRDNEDKAARLYLERCQKYSASPPAAWDGVDNLTEK